MKLSIHHISLRVTDLNRSVRFYRDTLGLEEQLYVEGAVALLGAGAATVSLWARASEPYAEGPSGLDHLAFSVENVDALTAAADELQAAGVKFDGDPSPRPLAPGTPIVGIWFHDPDGNRLEINAPGE